MPTRNQIKLVKSLQRKKQRQELGLFVVEGRKMVLEALKEGWIPDQLYCRKSVADLELLKDAEVVDENSMDRMSHLSSPSEALAVFSIPTTAPIEPGPESKILVLDGIKDPGNLGTLLRIVDWFNWDGLLCSPDTVDRFNSKAVQASMGSLFRVPVIYAELDHWLSQSNLKVVGTDMQGESIWQLSEADRKGLAVIIGSEAHGITEKTRSICDQMITIPGGGTESLNAGVAAGIILAALSR